jgi:hypothetical protein
MGNLLRAGLGVAATSAAAASLAVPSAGAAGGSRHTWLVLTQCSSQVEVAYGLVVRKSRGAAPAAATALQLCDPEYVRFDRGAGRFAAFAALYHYQLATRALIRALPARDATTKQQYVAWFLRHRRFAQAMASVALAELRAP